MRSPTCRQRVLYPGCDGDLVVADYVRLEKGHTEGYEPNLTAHLLELMAGAPQL